MCWLMGRKFRVSEAEGLSEDLFFAPLYARQEYWGGEGGCIYSLE